MQFALRARKYILYGKLRYYFSVFAPELFCRAERIKNGTVSRSVRRDTNLVIEGFPRSGNSYVMEIIRRRLKPGWHVAHHLHLPVQVELAVRWKLPTMVLFREPDEAIISLAALQYQAESHKSKLDSFDMTDMDLSLRLQDITIFYNQYYARILKLEPWFLIVPFSIVRHDFSLALNELNNRYKLGLDNTTILQSEREKTLNSDKYHIGPNAERDSYKQRISRIYDDTVPANMKKQAWDSYYACMEICKLQNPSWIDFNKK